MYMNNKISDNKKFWLITTLYLLVFWILPLQPILANIIFSFLNNVLLKIGINVESIFLYFIIFIPIVIILSYLYIKNLNIKYKKTIFVSMFILITYIPLLLFFLIGLSKITIQF